MTAGFRTMLAIEGDITQRYSIAGVTARHTTGANGTIRPIFNESWRQLREIVSMASDGSYLVGTAFANLPTTAAVTGETYAEVDWPLDAIGVYGVRVLPAAGARPYPLKRIPFAAYQDYQSSNLILNSASGMPIGYTSRLLPDGVTSTETVGKVMITPVPTRGTYRLWYLQAFTAKLADTDTFNGMAGFHRWAVLDTCIQMLGTDADSQNQYTMWDRERKLCRDLIEARAQKLEAGIGIEPRDGRNDGYQSFYGDEL